MGEESKRCEVYRCISLDIVNKRLEKTSNHALNLSLKLILDVLIAVYYLRKRRIIPLFISIILEHLWFAGL